MAHELPVVRIKGELFTVDDRLCELRPNENPASPIRFDIIPEMSDYLRHGDAEIVEPFQRFNDGKLVPCNDDDRFLWLVEAADWNN